MRDQRQLINQTTTKGADQGLYEQQLPTPWVGCLRSGQVSGTDSERMCMKQRKVGRIGTHIFNPSDVDDYRRCSRSSLGSCTHIWSRPGEDEGGDSGGSTVVNIGAGLCQQGRPTTGHNIQGL